MSVSWNVQLLTHFTADIVEKSDTIQITAIGYINKTRSTSTELTVNMSHS